MPGAGLINTASVTQNKNGNLKREISTLLIYQQVYNKYLSIRNRYTNLDNSIFNNRQRSIYFEVSK